MSWSPLATQFCLEISFGVLFALAFVPKAPVGVLFYRILGTTALVPLLVALAAPVGMGLASWQDPVSLLTICALVAYPVYSGPTRGRLWAAGLGLGIVGSAGGVVVLLAQTGVQGLSGLSGPGLALGGMTALANGAVAGSVGLAMVLGHWYLTVPNLQISHLVRLNRLTMACMGAALLLLLLSLLVEGAPVNARGDSILRSEGLWLHLGPRVVAGLLFPLVFAAMTASSLRYKNTRSATGILYASTVFVLIGAFASVALQDAYGMPL